MEFVAPSLVAAGFLVGCGVTPQGGVIAPISAVAKAAASDTTFSGEPPAVAVIPAATRLQPALETSQKAPMPASGLPPTSGNQLTDGCPPDGTYKADRMDVAGKIRIDYRGEKAPFLCRMTVTTNGVTTNLVGVAGIPGHEYVNYSEVAGNFEKALNAPAGSIFHFPMYIQISNGPASGVYKYNGIINVLPTTLESWKGQSRIGLNLQFEGQTIGGRTSVYQGKWIQMKVALFC